MAILRIGVHQVYFRDNQKNRLDPSFLEYDNSNVLHKDLYEYGPMLDIYERGIYKENDYTGVFSYKFNTKCNLSGKTFKEFVLANPGYDVYFINPYPQLSYFYNNVWEQGECWHPGLKKTANILLKKLNICNRIDEVPRHDIDLASYANFWIGNKFFWDSYGKILMEIGLLFKKEEFKEILFKSTYHSNSTAPFFPFFIERLFSTYISLHTEIKCLAYSYTLRDIKGKCFFEEEKKLFDQVVSSNANDKRNINEVSLEHCRVMNKLFKTRCIPKQLL